jgi:hypothetical protein
MLASVQSDSKANVESDVQKEKECLERLVTDEGMPIVLINVPENAESGI